MKQWKEVEISLDWVQRVITYLEKNMSISVQLVEYLLVDNLKYFSTSGSGVTRDTVFENVITDFRLGDVSPRTNFKNVSRHDIVVNLGPDKPWPENWIKLTSAILAPKLASQNLAGGIP